MKSWKLLLSIGLLWVSPYVFANQQNWNQWLADVRQEALSQGIAPQTLDEAFAGMHEPNRQVKSFSRSQPEHRLTFEKYLHSRVDSYRVAIGRKEYQRNKALLDKGYISDCTRNHMGWIH